VTKPGAVGHRVVEAVNEVAHSLDRGALSGFDPFQHLVGQVRRSLRHGLLLQVSLDCTGGEGRRVRSVMIALFKGLNAETSLEWLDIRMRSDPGVL
jgi:hypothetical protein